MTGNQIPAFLVPGSLIYRVGETIESRSLTLNAASAEIGVSSGTLKKHLSGEHVRSDSALKYQDWLAGKGSRNKSFIAHTQNLSSEESSSSANTTSSPPEKPRFIVDVFSGCGGLSLGFDLLDQGRQFETILAIDADPSAIQVFNRNAYRQRATHAPVGRQTDLTEFRSETEFLVFFIDHTSCVLGDDVVSTRLYGLLNGAYGRFRADIAAADRQFISSLTRIWGTRLWRDAVNKAGRDSLTQTSVLAFQDRLKLPRFAAKMPYLPNILWREGCATAGAVFVPLENFVKAAAEEWEQEKVKLQKGRGATSDSHPSVSARRISSFLGLLESSEFSILKAEWVKWRACRLQLGTVLFGDEDFARDVRNLYQSSYPVSVLVGGPPCQGFSRIGRGKIRSLRDANVHAHGSQEAGDSRNLLFFQYVLILEALRPDAFVFENVQHFQSSVKADEGDFQATDVLREAIANLSDGTLSYAVTSAVINASRYGIPQSRIRYFMCGVRESVGTGGGALERAEMVLNIPRGPELPTSAAISDLPIPEFVGDGIGSDEAMRKHVAVGAQDRNLAQLPHYFSWIRQCRPGQTKPPRSVDSHVARSPRQDDAAFFGLIGPGKRWMDYRADNAQTAIEIRAILDMCAMLTPALWEQACQQARQHGRELPDQATLRNLAQRADGALPLRLILEQISWQLGFDHHLIKDSYLAKRDSAHGDWLSRMDSKRPSKTMVSHMSKDTYAFVHPDEARTISVREAARIQSFPDWFSFADASLTEAFKMVGNAVPPMLSSLIAGRVANVLSLSNKPFLTLITSRKG